MPIKGISIGLMLLLLCACQPTIQQPELKEITNFQILDASTSNIDITAEALLYNPNPVGATITGAEFDVFIEDKAMGVISQTDRAEIGAKEDFKFILKAKINPKGMGDNLLGILGQVLQIISKKEVNVRLAGHFKMEFFGQEIKLPFEQEKLVPIGK